jgi:hypothetical protein
LAAIAVLLLTPFAALSQTEPASLQITRVDATGFPDVHLQVSVLDASGNPIETVAASYAVVEDGVPFSVSSAAMVDVGVRVFFVADPGDGYGSTGVRFSEVLETAAENINWFVSGRPWMDPAVDEVGLLIQEGPTANILVPLTSDAAPIAEALQSYAAPGDWQFAPHHGDFTRAALMRALDEIEFSPSAQGKLAAIVLFTSGSRADYADVAERAIELGIPIYIILVRTTATEPYVGYWSDALQPLVEVTTGEFISTSEVTGMEPLFGEVISHRAQTILTYRAASASAGARQVTLDLTTASLTLSASSQYSVSVEPPEVSILTPGPGTVVRRMGLDRQSPPEEAIPDSMTVVAQVTWPDGMPRRLRAARLLVDDLPVGQPRLTEAGAEITWDLRGYQAEAEVPAVLIVQVEDELGLQASSAPTTVAVEYQPQSGIELSESVLIYISAGVALLALGLAVFLFINRQKLGPALQQASEGFVDFVERVTGRRSSLVARAYLVPMEGFDEPQMKSYEIYGTTAIGRSRRHADLLFHINEDDSPISRLHCTILDEEDHFTIRDEDSSNGTYLNGEKLTPLTAVVLQDGDTIDVAPLERGGLRFIFQVAGVDGSHPQDDDEIRRTRPRRRSEASDTPSNQDEG